MPALNLIALFWAKRAGYLGLCKSQHHRATRARTRIVPVILDAIRRRTARFHCDCPHVPSVIMLVQCIRLIQRLLHNLAPLRLPTDALLKAGLLPRLALRMAYRALAWLIPTRFLPSVPEQLNNRPPGRRSSTISVNLSAIPRALFQRRLDTLPMHVGDSSSPSPTLNSPISRPGQKSTFDDLGYPYAESSELEKDGIFTGPTSSSPVPEETKLKYISEDEGMEPGGYRHLNMSEAVPGLVAVTSYEYERYSRGVITCVPDSW